MDLVLHDVPLVPQCRAEEVRMNVGTACVGEGIIQAAHHVPNPSVRGPAGTGLIQDRHLVGDFIADEREGVVVQVCQVDLR